MGLRGIGRDVTDNVTDTGDVTDRGDPDLNLPPRDA